MSETKHNFPGGISFFFNWINHETPVNAENLDWIGFEFHQVEYNIGTNAQGGHGTIKGRFNFIEGDYVKKSGGNFEGNVGFNYYNIEYCYAYKVYLPDTNEKDLQERIVELESKTFPAGIISMWSGAIVDIPNGWVICDGNNGTPDLRDKFITGAGSSYGVGDTGGENTHQLSIGEIPSHNHGAVGNHSHSYTRYRTTWRINTGTTANVWYDASSVGTGGAGGHTHSSNGGDVAHENRPPYYALAFIMKT